MPIVDPVMAGVGLVDLPGMPPIPTGYMLANISGSTTFPYAVPFASIPAGSLVAGTTTVSGGTTSGTLWNNAGTLAVGPNQTSATGGLILGGPDAAAAVAQTVQFQGVATGTADTAGALALIKASPSTGSAAGGNILFQVTPAGSAGSTQNTYVNRLALTPTMVQIGGSLSTASVTVNIGNNTTTGYILRASANMTGSITSRGIRIDSEVQSGVTTAANFFETSVSTAATAFTVTDLRHYLAGQGGFGAGSTVTNQYGFQVASTLTGATNNYGFHSSLAAASNRWNFYAAGTAANLFVSDLTLYGTTAVPAGGTAGSGLKFSSTANLGVFFGSGAPSLSAAKGSLYLRTDGSGVNDRMYVNTNGTTTWTAAVTVA